MLFVPISLKVSDSYQSGDNADMAYEIVWHELYPN